MNGNFQTPTGGSLAQIQTVDLGIHHTFLADFSQRKHKEVDVELISSCILGKSDS